MIEFYEVSLCTCGKKVFVNTSIFALAHESPHCKNFENLDVVDFLKYLNKNSLGFVLTEVDLC
jgi:hypothetical protein